MHRSSLHMSYFKIKNSQDKKMKLDVTFEETKVTSNYIRVDDRVNIYANSTNTYISLFGQKCIDYEDSLTDAITLYTDGICPYCKKKIEMPKQKKSCPHCKQKVHVVEGGLHQGKLALTEPQYLELKLLKEAFYNDRYIDPMYKNNTIVKNPQNELEDKYKNPPATNTEIQRYATNISKHDKNCLADSSFYRAHYNIFKNIYKGAILYD